MKELSTFSWEGVEKLLIRAPNWVGDAVMSLPAITSVRAYFPEAENVILARPWVGEIFQGNPIADRVIRYQNAGLHGGLRGKWRLAQELRQESFDFSLHLPNSFESAFISFLAGISRRAGYDTDARGLLLTHPVRVNPGVKKKHQVDYYLEMVASLGFPPVGRIPKITLGPEKREIARQMFCSLGLPAGADFVGLSPGTTYGSAKEWFPERFGILADCLKQRLGAQILLLGSSGDRKVAELVCRSARNPLVDLTGKTNLAQAMALIARCRLFVTNDSGLMHVAAALGVPVIAIFGSTDPQRTGPLGGISRVLRKAIPCAPCFKTQCPEDRRCMEMISVDEVFEEVEKLWHLTGE